MSNEDVLHTVSIYFKGDDITPESLTARFGVKPTKSHKKGDKAILSSGTEIVRNTGLWVLSIEAKSPIDLPAVLQGLTSKLLASEVSLSELPGVEDAYVDVFIAKMSEDNSGGTCEFHLDGASFAVLHKLGLPMQFTVAVVPK